MDKILRRVRMAERQVARRAQRKNDFIHRLTRAKRNQQVNMQLRQASYEIGAAVRARHEDLELGPLAPRRDVHKLDAYENYWGSISTERALLQTKISDAQKEARAAWAGGVRYLCLRAGDRIVITEGPDKGKITTIAGIKKDTMTLELDGNVGIVNVKIPPHMAEEGKPPVQQIKAVVPVSAVRLVHPLADPKTGVVRDVIIRELKPIGITHDRPTREVFFQRVVPGLNVEIPWPEESPKTDVDYPGDTLRIDVEERSFIPTLLRLPMPEAVIDELRNKYSKFRTRHTPEYIALIEAQEAEKKLRQKGARADEMLLPLKEFNRKMRALRRERGPPQLSDEMLEKIGEVIARNKLARGENLAGKLAPAASADEGVETVQKAVEELSLGGDAQATEGEEQPRP
ncbi:hypothetical protein C8A05DRAFT_42988 [Staphylotrichum tortipilum]|uniref:KOW domain-containing protein n=1 Tax=Staphylotrichum tortipilum TaxID=2831512 RepID=A0AAN6RVC6_9PEZI|nr:hypothetical protein C8A05DRAFT_42988 [Staphylotrichum longicolle]